VNGLHDELDRALRALPLRDAPVDRARREGRRLRTRRRLGAAAGALAVIATAVAVPAVTTGTSAGPGPVTGVTGPGGDPYLTAGLPSGTNRAADGVASGNGQVAVGVVGSTSWQVTVSGPRYAAGIATYCYTLNPAPAGESGAQCSDIAAGSTPATKASPANPAWFSESGNGTLGVVIGVAAPEVTYVVVTFADGQQLKLIPVTVGGHRFIAWVQPLDQRALPIARVAAHLGGPYTDGGQVMVTVPVNRGGGPPAFGRWQPQGSPSPATPGSSGP